MDSLMQIQIEERERGRRTASHQSVVASFQCICQCLNKELRHVGEEGGRWGRRQINLTYPTRLIVMPKTLSNFRQESEYKLCVLISYTKIKKFPMPEIYKSMKSLLLRRLLRCCFQLHSLLNRNLCWHINNCNEMSSASNKLRID